MFGNKRHVGGRLSAATMNNCTEPTSDVARVETGIVLAASEKYVAELDGIRALAVGLVVSAHYALIPYTPGGFGVTLFFFLSGYLITTLFYSEYGSTRNINIPQFYLRRWLRLTPPLVVSVVLGTVFYRVTRNAVGGQPVPTGTTMAALLYYTNYYDLSWGMEPAKVIPFGINWSLAIEEHFYLIWPLLLCRNIRNAQRVCLLVTALCVGVLAWRFAARYILAVSTDYTYMATDCRIDSILYGALLRILFEISWASAVIRVLRARICQLLALLALVATFIIRDENFRQSFRYTMQGIALMPLFTAVLCDDPKALVRRVLSSPPMVLIGRLSYSIYLFHLLARTPGEVYFGSSHRAGAVISGLLLTGSIAYFLFILVERPIARLRRRLRVKGGSAHPVTTIAPPSQSPMITLPRQPTPSL
jgi:peptidoglycan/LPS O-acetylase OafA/YrhL